MSEMQTESRRRGRPAGSKNKTIPDAWKPLVDKLGGVTKTAEACKVSYVTLRRWLDGGNIHETHLTDVRAAALSADVASPV